MSGNANTNCEGETIKYVSPHGGH